MLLIFTILLPSVIIALIDWRKGLFLTVITALVQDPLRKLTPDQPVYFVVLAGGVFAASYVSAVLRNIPLRLMSIPGWKQELRAPISLFILLLAVQTVISYARYRNPMLPAIGLLFYLAPGTALIMGYHFAVRRGMRGVEDWLRFYLILSVVSLTSVYLQYAGFDWPVLGEVGGGIKIYDMGTVLTAHSGFFRASEIAAWHSATAACMLFLIGTRKRMTFGRIVAAGLIMAFLIGIGVLTGRRKMLVEISIFLITYLGIFLLLQKQRGRSAVVVLLFGVIAFFSIVGLAGPDLGDRDYQKERYRLYVDRSRTVVDDIPDRVSNLGLQPVMWAVNNFGFFGAGLGIGSQGTQHFGGGAEVFGGAAEGGLGKLTMELGIPGLILAGFVLFRLYNLIWRNLRAVSRFSEGIARLSYGLLAFLIANIATFFVATQAFGDLFIQLFLGMMLGFLLATPTIAEREANDIVQRKIDRPAFVPGRKGNIIQHTSPKSLRRDHFR